MADRFFVHTDDGVEFCATEEEARRIAQDWLDWYRSECESDAEGEPPSWPEGVANIKWGEIREQATAHRVDGSDDDDDDRDYVDYTLDPLVDEPDSGR